MQALYDSKQVTFSYFIPKKKVKYCDVKLSLSFENFVTLTHYSGYDPEASVYTDNSFSDFAVDRGHILFHTRYILP